MKGLNGGRYENAALCTKRPSLGRATNLRRGQLGLRADSSVRYMRRRRSHCASEEVAYLRLPTWVLGVRNPLLQGAGCRARILHPGDAPEAAPNAGDPDPSRAVGQKPSETNQAWPRATRGAREASQADGLAGHGARGDESDAYGQRQPHVRPHRQWKSRHFLRLTPERLPKAV